MKLKRINPKKPGTFFVNKNHHIYVKKEGIKNKKNSEKISVKKWPGKSITIKHNNKSQLKTTAFSVFEIKCMEAHYEQKKWKSHK
jgi:hypothetical protein